MAQSDMKCKEEVKNSISMAELGHIFEALPLPVAICTQKNSQIIAANSCYLEMIACEAEAVVGHPFTASFEWIKPLARQRLAAVIQHDGAVREVTMPLRLHSGEEHILQCHIEPMTLDAAPHCMITCRDLTDQLLGEGAFEESHRVLTLLMDNLPGLVYRCSRDEAGWALRFVSNGFERLTGYQADDWIGRPWNDLMAAIRHPSAWIQSDCELDERALEGHTFDTVYRIRTAKGEEKWVWEQGRLAATGGDPPDVLEGFIADITQAKQAEDVLQHSYEQLSRLTERLHTVREEERTRIAYEIHDHLGHSLAVLKLDLEWLALQDLDAPVLDRIAQTKEQLLETIHDVRRIATDLRPTLLDNFGLGVTLEWHAAKFETHAGIVCSFTAPPAEVTPDHERDTHIFRIFQEILTNIARHARAKNIWITFVEQEGHLVLMVQDDGRGISSHDLENVDSLGLVGMRERARQLGGTFNIHGIPGKGTRVTLNLPPVAAYRVAV